MKGIYNYNTSKHIYEYTEIIRAAEKKGIILTDAWAADKSEHYAFTLNRAFYAMGVGYQQGTQINRITDGIFWKDKDAQLKYLNTYVPKPKTLFGSHTFDECRDYLGYPFIAKRSISSQGNGVFLIRSVDDFDAATHCNIYQELIWDSMGQDLRVWVLGGEIIGVMNRKNENDFKANVHQGGYGIPYKCNDEIEKCVNEIYTQTGLDIMGIDLLIGKDSYLFCELNVSPGFRGFDGCLGIRTGQEIVNYIEKKVKS